MVDTLDSDLDLVFEFLEDTYLSLMAVTELYYDQI